MRMKKIAALVLLFLSIVNTLNAQTNVKSDVDYKQLKGKVKEVISHIYYVTDSTGKQEMTWVYAETESFNKEGNLIFEKTVNAKTYFNDSTHYTYDSLQNVLTETVFGEHNVLEKRYVRTYDTNSKILTETELHYDIDEDSGKVTDSFGHVDRYTYNGLNLVAEIRRSSLESDRTISPYRLYIKNVYEDSGRIRYQYEYRSAKQPAIADTSYMQKNRQGKIVKGYNAQTSSLYYYDSLNQLIKVNSLMLQADSVYYHVIFTYDKRGNKNSTTTYDNAGKVTGAKLTSTFYAIDRKGNWRKVKGYKDGKLTYYCTRKIKYY
jgi:hypothetical protein